MGAPRGNTNAKNKKSETPRISVSMGISQELRDLFSQYLALQGLQDSEENIKKVARDQAYIHWERWLADEICKLQ